MPPGGHRQETDVAAGRCGEDLPSSLRRFLPQGLAQDRLPAEAALTKGRQVYVVERSSALEPTVSVIIPTYERAGVLGRAIDSVLGQTRPAEELLVVDDGSEDRTAELVASYPGVRYERIAHRGVSAARNRGIALATGVWLAFLDSDDEWLPAKLAEQLAALESSPEHRVCHTGEVWIRGGRRVNPRRHHRKHGGWIFRHCLPLCAISPSSVLVHRSVFDEVGTFDEAFPACEDYDLWLRVASRYPVLYVDRPMLRKYGGHEDQLSRRVPALDRYRIRALEKILASGVLGDEDRRAAVATLIGKIDVYRQGAAKRGRWEEVAGLDELRDRWAPT